MTAELSIASRIRMNNGTEMPRFGLGVFRAGPGPETENAVSWALGAGYRHIDTARVYGNEKEVGNALRKSSVPREDIFVTTKLWNRDQGYEQTLRAFDKSLADLGLDYVDLYLMHWPVPEHRRRSYAAMEKIYAEGRAKAIGVSNFATQHLEELSGYANTPPAVNQVELHPFGQQRAIAQWCQEHGVVVEAYSPVTKGQRLDDPTLVSLAQDNARTPAQILIRWSLQKDYVVIPKSTNRGRIEENAEVFDFALSSEAMQRLDELEEGLHLAWDPTDAP